MRRLTVSVAVAVATIIATAGFVAPTPGLAASTTPRWVRHVRNFPGGISNTVRFTLDPQVVQAQRQLGSDPPMRRAAPAVTNLQMNDDSFPQMPQNEESVAYSLDDPMVAVAAANDYVSGGVVVMRTTNGGRSWLSTRVVPVFRPTSDACSGGDPSVAYSRRDHAFYLAQLCFFRTITPSEVQVFKSLDNGATWTPGRRAAVAATNSIDPTTGETDPAFFNDKELIAVDNTPTSPHYGRLYVTYTRFHILASGSSDSCPIQVSYTDNVPSADPSLAVWQHAPVVPDDFGGTGVGESANQFSMPVVEKNGALDIAYVLEECNSSIDHGLRFQKSTDGGATFLPTAIRVNKPGQWADNPDAADLIPHTAFRTPNTVAMAYSKPTGTLAYVYTNYIHGAAHGNIDVSVSHDGGATWSNSHTISLKQGQPARGNQFFPWIAATPNGKFYAMWLDRRQDPANHDIGTFQARSPDDGATWPNKRLSTETWDPDLGFFSTGAFIGDYSGIAASNRAIYAAWTDGRNTNIVNTGVGETDVFTAPQILGS
jgi:hypothetical protein